MEKKQGKRRGRPVGTTKNGKKTLKQKFKYLRTKSWVWACSQLCSRNPPEPAGQDSIAAAANRRTSPLSEFDDFEKETYSGGTFSRYRRGIRGAKPSTVRALWPEVQDAYFVGPLVSSEGGVFTHVPLWSAIRGDVTGMLHEWECAQLPPQLNHFSLKGEELCVFFQDVLNSPPDGLHPLFLLSVVICKARLTHKPVRLFDPQDPNFPLPAELRAEVIEDLSKMNITLSELLRFCFYSGLVIKDRGMLTEEELLQERRSDVWGRRAKYLSAQHHASLWRFDF
jgi:hypothetical protein